MTEQKKFFFVGYCQIHCIERHVLQTSKGFCFFFVSWKFAKRTARYSEFGSNRVF